jgi:hypothetical protein
VQSDSEFIEAFTAFLRDVVERHGLDAAGPGPMANVLSEHFGHDSAELTVVAERLSRARLVDADIVLEKLAADGRLVGIAGARHDDGLTFLEMVRGQHGPVDLGAVEYVALSVGPSRERQVVARGIWLFTIDGEPVAVLQRDAREEWDRMTPTLEVMAVDRSVAATFLTMLRAAMREHSVLRGQVLSFTGDQYGSSLGGVTFHERPQVSAEEVILPGDTLQKIERHAILLGEHREAMLGAGQHLKRGILLFGPPGTGKTHTVRHLLGRSPDTTAILLSGNTLGYVREAAQLARAMEPAMVVLEDCDLIAEDRDMMDSPHSMLFELLESLDGLDGDANVTFLLTTNRPDLLERALAQRPGRIDLAVEIPLPDIDERRALFTLYTQDQGFSADVIAAAADRAEGVTASFAKELVRRAVLSASIDGRSPADADLVTALDELLSDQSALTRSLLASGPRTFEEDAVLEDLDEDW